MATREMKQPGTDHPITIEPAGIRVSVRVADLVLAASTDALALHEAGYPPVYYVPMSDVDSSLLVPSDTSTYCPYKGDASYYSLAAGDTRVDDVLWTYREPYPAVAEIAEHAAFYPDRVEITVG